MGMLQGILGNASEIDVRNLDPEIEAMLVEGEKAEKGYKLIRDQFIFTSKRLILVDKQGMTGKKVEYHSIPYGNISHFSVETAGHLDMNAELKIWIKGGYLISKAFKADSNIAALQHTLAFFVLHA